MINSMAASITSTINILANPLASYIWRKASTFYGKSKVEERHQSFIAFRDLQLKDNDYFAYQQEFISLIEQHRRLEDPMTDSTYQEFFIAGLGNWNKSFINTKLDEHRRANSHDGKIINLDLDALMEELAARASSYQKKDLPKKDNNSSKKANKSSSSTDKPSDGKSTDKDRTKKSDKKSASSRKDDKPPIEPCKICRFRHPNTCFWEDPHNAPQWWKDNNSLLLSKIPPPVSQSKDMTVYSQGKIAASFAANHADDSANWFFDTCASYHISPDRSAFISYAPLDPSKLQPSDYVKNANGGISACQGVGTVLVAIGDGSMILQNTRFNPAFESNLISHSALIRQGYHINMPTSDSFNFTSPDGGIFEAAIDRTTDIIRISDCLRPADSSPVSAYASVKRASGTDDSNQPKKKIPLPIMEWHRRLCHLNKADILRLARDPESAVAISGSKDLPFCSICTQAHQTRHYSKKARTRQTRPLARIHMDLAGGGKTLNPDAGLDGTETIEPSRIGAKFVMILTDDATRFRWVFYLTKKSDAIDAFKDWLASIKKMGFNSPSYMVSDNEFHSHDWITLRSQETIQWQPSNPYSQWQDGVSERAIKLVFDRARAMMLDAPHIPWKFWSDAVQQATAITNILPTSVPLYNDSTPDGISTNPDIKPSVHKHPLGAWFNTSADCSHIHRWGSPVWVHLHGLEKPITKLSPRSKKCFLIGCIGTNVYRCWDPEKDVVFNTGDIIFEDDHHTIEPTPVLQQQPADQTQLADRTQLADQKQLSNNSVDSQLNDADDAAPANSDTWLRPAKGFKIASIATAAAAPHTKNPSSSAEDDTPYSYKQAVSRPDAQKWKAGMEKEIQQLKEKNCWRLIKRSDVPSGHKVITGRWVYKKKQIGDTPLDQDYQAKARWVIRGNLMDKDFMESYAPVVSEPTTKLLMALSVQNSWHTRKGDVTLAFLNGEIDPNRKIYMAQPLGYREGDGDLVCELQHSLYGLVPAARIWYDTFSAKMKQLGFSVCAYDPGLWIHSTRPSLYITTHVDDVSVYSKDDNDGQWAMDALAATFEMKDIGPATKFLGMKVTNHQDGSLTIDQHDYTLDLITSFGLADCYAVKTPIDAGLIINDQPDPTNPVDQKEYQRGVGALNWLAVKTRPDLSRAVGVLAQYNARPTRQAWAALKHTLRYLKGTLGTGITYRPSTNDSADISTNLPVGYTDSDWAGPLTGDRRSISGYLWKLAGAPIAWRSQKQTSIALSSNEAEYMAASEAAKEGVWLRNILKSLHLPQFDDPNHFPPLQLHIDNTGAIAMANDILVTKRSKHIDARYHFLKEKVADGCIEQRQIPTASQAADGLTKPLRFDKFDHFLQLSGMKQQKPVNRLLTPTVEDDHDD